MTAVETGTVIAWATDNVALAITALITALTVLVLTYLVLSRLVRRTTSAAGKIATKAARKLDVVVMMAALVAAAATIGSMQAMWEVLHKDLGITDQFMRSCVVIVLDGIGIMSAIMSREDRINRPGTIGLNSIAVWVVAVLLGAFGANEANSDSGAALRFVIPLGAAWMWDRVIHRDVTRAATLDKARVSTITGRAARAIGRAIRAAWGTILRIGAHAGIALPDDDVAQIQRRRWIRGFIRAAAAAAAARATLERTPDTDDKATRKAIKARDRAYDRFNSTVTRGLEIGAVETKADIVDILRSASLALNATDILDQAQKQSAWKVGADRPTPTVIDPPTDRPDVVDVEVVDRPTDDTDRPTTVIDRPTDRPEPVDADRPIEPTEIIDRPGPTGRELDRPTDRIRSTEPVDRPTVNIQIVVSTDREQRLIRTLADLVLDQGVTRLPSQSRLADAAELPKTTVGDIMRRWGLPKEITDDVAAAIEQAHTAG